VAPIDTVELQAEAEAGAEKSASEPKLLLLMGVVFFFSGFSSLIYEVVWMRRLSLFFGSDVYSAALTLSAFMGGLTLGSLLAARYSDHLKKPLVWYGLLEISIGFYALFFPNFLNMFAGEYRRIYQSYFSSAPWLYNSFRILVASITLLIPTTMMGSTLPLVVKRFARQRGIGKYSGFFYSINTFGALTGVLGVGFVLLPNIGISTTTKFACSINVIIGLLAVGFGLFSTVETDVAERPAAPSSHSAEPAYDSALEKAGLIGIGLSGLAALALEVVWMRILTQSFSGAVYSFSIMLSCFLFGIYFGSKKIADVIDQRADPMRLFGFLELSIGLMVALLGILTYFVPRFFSNLLWLLTAISRGHFGFACTAAEFAVSGFLIAIPTILMGATFPVAVKICTPTIDSIGRGTARVYAANTAGAIVGSLLGGLILLPAFGNRVSLLIIASIFTVTGLYLLCRAANRGWVTLKDLQVVTIVGLFAVFVIVTLLLPRQIVTNFYYAGNEKAKVIYHGEGIAHTIDIIKTDKNVTIMQVNGTLEADTTYSQRRHFILKAHLPLLLHPNPREVAVVGLGLGITLSATNRHPGLDQIQLIELSPEMVKAQSHLEDVSGGVLRSSKVKLRIDDGRNFMAMSNKQFDMITADPIHPRVSGVGYLYTKEYYEALKQRLRPDGVVCQWMPMYRISKKSFDVAFRTFVSVFPNASFWYVRGHGLFVATQDNFSVDYQNLEQRIEDPVIKVDLASINIRGAAQFMSYMLMGPAEIRAYLAAFPGPLNTDDNAYLEYHTPFEFLESTKTIVAGLIPYAALDVNVIRNASDDERKQLTQEWSRRKAELLPEFDSKLDE
jgi:spermidine synthase